MLKEEGKSLDNNHEPQDLNDKKPVSHKSPPIFILCDICYWCATYFYKTRLPLDNKCPQCNNACNNELIISSIMSNESIAFDYNDKHGV
jgi:hypothetical protein